MLKKIFITTTLVGIFLVACSEDSDSVAGFEEDAGVIASLDTVFVHDSVKVCDTLTIKDTVSLTDTLSIQDTVTVLDTVSVKDTLSVHDTVAVKDTVNVHDTVEVLEAVVLAGVAQKGPFIKGSEISAYTLGGSEGLGEKVASIGNVYTKDDGSYSVDGVSLSSRVSVSVKGAFRRELHGDVANYEVSMRAVSEVGGSQTCVNVNVLTELEYDRVDYLLRNNADMTFAEAKKQAQKEVFAIFGIDAEGFANSENLNVLGSSEGDAALLAVSVMLESAAKYRDLKTIFKQVGSDIAKDGVLDNWSFLQLVANDMMVLDVRGDLDEVEKNIVSWGYDGKVADFQKYIREYWQKSFGFEECGSAAAPEGASFGYESSVYKCKNGKWEFDEEISSADTFTDGRDGQTYKMVTIGDQTWMAENLNYALKLEQEDGTVKKFSWCGGGDSASTIEGDCSLYGMLYPWSGAVDSAGVFSDDAKGCGYQNSCELGQVRGVCPEGWHLPNKEEWEILLENLGGGSAAAKKLKARRGWRGYYYNGAIVSGNGTDDVGFTAVPSGVMYGGVYYDVGNVAIYHSSTTDLKYPNFVYEMSVDGRDDIYVSSSRIGEYRAVRCIKD